MFAAKIRAEIEEKRRKEEAERKRKASFQSTNAQCNDSIPQEEEEKQRKLEAERKAKEEREAKAAAEKKVSGLELAWMGIGVPLPY